MSISKYCRLKDTHPTVQKFDKLCQLADELGLSLQFAGGCILNDKEYPDLDIRLIDADSMDAEVHGFPPLLEFIYLIPNPAYLKEQQRLEQVREEERKRKQAEKLQREEQERIKREEKEAARKEEEAARVRVAELNLLAELKKKYETS